IPNEYLYPVFRIFHVSHGLSPSKIPDFCLSLTKTRKYMLPKIDFTTTQAYRYLADHYIDINAYSLKELFEQDPHRFEKFSLSLGDILLDYSKNRVNEQKIALLMQLARECQLDRAIEMMFSGKPINETEGRAVLHTALRNRSGSPVVVDGADIMPDIQAVLDRMRSFSNRVISGEWKGYTGQEI